MSLICEDGTPLVAAGGDQPVDDLDVDRIGQGVGGDAGRGRIAVVEQLEREFEADRIEPGRRRRAGRGNRRRRFIDSGRLGKVAVLAGVVFARRVGDECADRVFGGIGAGVRLGLSRGSGHCGDGGGGLAGGVATGTTAASRWSPRRTPANPPFQLQQTS